MFLAALCAYCTAEQYINGAASHLRPSVSQLDASAISLDRYTLLYPVELSEPCLGILSSLRVPESQLLPSRAQWMCTRSKRPTKDLSTLFYNESPHEPLQSDIHCQTLQNRVTGDSYTSTLRSLAPTFPIWARSSVVGILSRLYFLIVPHNDLLTSNWSKTYAKIAKWSENVRS